MSVKVRSTVIMFGKTVCESLTGPTSSFPDQRSLTACRLDGDVLVVLEMEKSVSIVVHGSGDLFVFE
jgi:hypothetical protein